MSDAYARAGVDIAAGNAAVSRYQEVTSGWRHTLQLGSIGGFSGLFALPGEEQRALVASTDGVGTKIYGSVGADLVNHCVNDILVTNATPLFFLDYLAVGKLDPQVAGELVAGVQQACQAHNMALLGGETAEMPGLYTPGDFDLAGTIVGIVDRDRVPNPANVEAGDMIIGLPAIGLHTNGYSMARAVFSEDEWNQNLPGTDVSIIDALLASHPSYRNEVLAIEKVAKIRSMAHITGGGLLENVPRTLPPGLVAAFDATRWSVPPICTEIVRRGKLNQEERYRTLNMGVGYTIIVPAEDASRAADAVAGAAIIGKVIADDGLGVQVRIENTGA
jgi:phosphoribosylformylglycinamidine cyclo-ligase